MSLQLHEDKILPGSTIGGRSVEGVGLPGAFNTDALLHAPCVQRRTGETHN